MANPEHRAILAKGVEAWNEWRRQNPKTRPDLRGVSLPGAPLARVNFNGVNLDQANLLTADLREASLSGANLTAAKVAGADFCGADLAQANLNRADLYGVRAVGANLQYASILLGQLCRCEFTKAILTGAKLYGTGRDDWTIEGIQCEYVFWDMAGKIRCPKDRDFAPGEFEQIYRTLPTIEYIFENGMTPLDPLIMDRVVQAIREQNPEYDIKIDSISARGLAPSIKFTVLLERYKEAARAQVRDLYEVKLRQVEAERDRYWAAISRALDRPSEIKLIAAAPGSVVTTDGSTVNIEQHIHQVVELQKAIAAQPEDSPTFAKVAKKTALDIIGSALKDVAKGQVKEAAKQICELGKDLGPVIVNTAAYAFFKSCLGL